MKSTRLKGKLYFKSILTHKNGHMCRQEPYHSGHPQKYYAITLDDYFSPGVVSGTRRYYGTLEEIEKFVSSLKPENFQDTIAAWQEYKNGNLDATHTVAYSSHKLLEPVRMLKESFLELENETWDFENVWGFSYSMQIKQAQAQVVLIQDGNLFIRCICPRIVNLCYKNEMAPKAGGQWTPIHSCWGHPGIVLTDEKNQNELYCGLHLPESIYTDLATAAAELKSKKMNLNVVCEEVFGDG